MDGESPGTVMPAAPAGLVLRRADREGEGRAPGDCDTVLSGEALATARRRRRHLSPEIRGAGDAPVRPNARIIEATRKCRCGSGRGAKAISFTQERRA
jgi:hypothetical protein